MKSPSIDSVYALLYKNLLLVEAYTEIPNLAFILKACRIKPYGYFFEKRTNKIILERRWFDEYGNSLILKNKKVKLIYGDLRLTRNMIACSDLYYGLDMSKIVKMSKSMYVTFGQDEDLYQDCALVSFLGIDDFLRTYLYYYGEWQPVSSLLLGMDGLGVIARYKDKNYHGQFHFSKNTRLPCTTMKTWLTYLPIRERFLSTLEQQCNVVASIFKGN